MINLIPPSAKKSVALEYWKRVIAVWLFLGSAAFVMVTVFLLPTHLSLRSEISFLEDAVTEGVVKVSSYDISASELTTMNNQAKMLLDFNATNTPFSLITALRQYASTDITLNNFSFSKLEISPNLTLAGVARSRQALAEFRDSITADKRFSTVNLPISNLIKEKDLLFSMEIMLATSSPL